MTVEPSASEDFNRMSDQLKLELMEAVKNGDLLLAPSPEVLSESIKFIRPRSESFTYAKMPHGNGRDGEGRVTGIGMSKSLVDYVMTLEYSTVPTV